MTEVRPFEPKHTFGMKSADMDLLHNLATKSESYTIIGNNKPIACGGVIDLYNNQTLWIIFSEGAGKYMLSIMRHAKRWLRGKSGKMIALVGTHEGARMAEILGMTPSEMQVDGAVVYEVVKWN